MSEYERELEWSIWLDLPWEGKGTGYVVDCLRSVFSGTSRDPGPTGYDPVWSHPMKVRRAHLEYLIRIASGDGTFTVNLHAPGSGRATNHESLAGAFGIPEFMPPNRRRDFHSKTSGSMMERFSCCFMTR